jgi:uncharacterized membrane protein YciS (DUF1049 family)
MTENELLHVTPRTLLFLLGVSFFGGTCFGWFLKSYRLKYLKMKRDFLERKFNEAQKRLQDSACISTSRTKNTKHID